MDDLLKQANEKKIKSQTTFTEEEAKKAQELYERMNMPIKVANNDIVFGKRELDIRELSRKNKDQLQFRTNVANSMHLNDIANSLVDIQRLLMALLYKLGVDNITDCIDETIEKLRNETKR